MIYLMTSDSWLDLLRNLWAIKPYGPTFIVFGTIMVLFFLIVFILAFKKMTHIDGRGITYFDGGAF